jgi:hypothetical protein
MSTDKTFDHLTSFRHIMQCLGKSGTLTEQMPHSVAKRHRSVVAGVFAPDESAALEKVENRPLWQTQHRPKNPQAARRRVGAHRRQTEHRAIANEPHSYGLREVVSVMSEYDAIGTSLANRLPKDVQPILSPTRLVAAWRKSSMPTVDAERSADR